MRVCKTRIAAWLLALLVNAFFVIYLLTVQRRAWVLAEPSLAQSRVQLYFISPPTPELPAAAVKNQRAAAAENTGHVATKGAAGDFEACRR